MDTTGRPRVGADPGLPVPGIPPAVRAVAGPARVASQPSVHRVAAVDRAHGRAAATARFVLARPVGGAAHAGRDARGRAIRGRRASESGGGDDRRREAGSAHASGAADVDPTDVASSDAGMGGVSPDEASAMSGDDPTTDMPGSPGPRHPPTTAGGGLRAFDRVRAGVMHRDRGGIDGVIGRHR